MIVFLILFILHGPVHNEAFVIHRLDPIRRSHRATQTPQQNHKQNLSLRLESPFGVRKRVRAVLERARKRQTPEIIPSSQAIPLSTYTQSSSPSALLSSSSSSSLKRSYTLNSTGAETPQVSTEYTFQPQTERLSTANSTRIVSPLKPLEIHHKDSTPIPSIPPIKAIQPTRLTSIDPSPTPTPTTVSTPAAAATAAVEPLPFQLPSLTQQQKIDLNRGQRIQVQENMGRQGYGYVVVDVKAPVDVVWHCLLDFNSYPQTIPTVRRVQMLTNTHLGQDYHSESELTQEDVRHLYEDGTLATLQYGVPSVTRAVFTLSKFQLKIAAIHKYRPHPHGDYMIFTLDPACTNVVLQMAKGTWHTQSNPENKGKEYTRVWLLCELRVSPLLPQFITDYAASRAMPRATTWIKPVVEAAAMLWLKKTDTNTRVGDA